MTLQQYQDCSAYMLRTRRSYHRYSPEDWRNKGKGKGKAMVETESDEEEEEEEELPEPEIQLDPDQFIRKKHVPKRGRRGGRGG